MNSPTLGHCLSTLPLLRDALDVVNGKWKLLILVALRTGHQRFREIERAIPGISSKVLAKELRDLEQHQLIRRTVQEGPPVLVSYEPLPHAETLDPVIFALREWGAQHREAVMGPEAAPKKARRKCAVLANHVSPEEITGPNYSTTRRVAVPGL